MKHLYSLLLITLLSISPALATALAPPDTVAGQTRVIRLLAADMCTRLTAEGEKRSLNDLSAEEAKELLTQTMLGSISANADELQPLLNKARGRRGKDLGENLGKEAMMLLMRQCPQGQALVMRLGISQAKIPAAQNAEEKALLDLVAQDICTRLDKATTDHPSAKNDAAERQGLFRDAMQGAMLAHLEDISKFYGFDKLQDRALMNSFGQKVAAQMGVTCPNYMVQMGLDATEAKGKGKGKK